MLFPVQWKQEPEALIATRAPRRIRYLPCHDCPPIFDIAGFAARAPASSAVHLSSKLPSPDWWRYFGKQRAASVANLLQPSVSSTSILPLKLISCSFSFTSSRTSGTTQVLMPSFCLPQHRSSQEKFHPQTEAGRVSAY